MEVNILVPFLMSANIAFIVLIMCLIFMIDIKVKFIAKNIARMTEIFESKEKT